MFIVRMVSGISTIRAYKPFCPHGESAADKIRMLRPAQILIVSATALLGVALVCIQSAAFRLSSPSDPLGLVGSSRHLIYALLALGAMLIASRLNVRQLLQPRGIGNPLFLIVLLSTGFVVLTLVPGVGLAARGAHRWLYLGPQSWGLTFQPSELVKWVLVVTLAWWCAQRRGLMDRFTDGLMPAALLLGLACGLILIEDFGTAVLVGAVGACMLLAGGARLWHLALILPPAIATGLLSIVHNPYRIRRLTAFVDPWADSSGAGYHPIQSMLAIAQGGIAGRGLGNGIQKFGYLPEDTTDFIFSVICEEMGLAGAVLVVGLYLTILWVGLGVLRDCSDTFGRLLAFGVLLTLGFQAAMNLAVVTVLVPTKGIALPLVSRGGTGWIMTAFALGLVAALDNNRVVRLPHAVESSGGGGRGQPRAAPKSGFEVFGASCERRTGDSITKS